MAAKWTHTDHHPVSSPPVLLMSCSVSEASTATFFIWGWKSSNAQWLTRFPFCLFCAETKVQRGRVTVSERDYKSRWFLYFSAVQCYNITLIFFQHFHSIISLFCLLSISPVWFPSIEIFLFNLSPLLFFFNFHVRREMWFYKLPLTSQLSIKDFTQISTL